MRAGCRQKTHTANDATGFINADNMRGVQIIKGIAFHAVFHLDLPAEPVTEDPRAQLVHFDQKV
jgi:uncharacterized protein YfdQ (DUF2303 family)